MTTKKATCYLIDPRRKMVYRVCEPITLDLLYDLIGCELVERVPLRNGDVAYVDEEALIRAKRPEHFVRLAPELYEMGPLAGNVVIVGALDHEGNDTRPNYSANFYAIRAWAGHVAQSPLGIVGPYLQFDQALMQVSDYVEPVHGLETEGGTQ